MTLTIDTRPGVLADTPVEYTIEAQGLRKSYGKVEAVKGVDLAVKRGQIYALLGPNGAGKTTTINMLTTLTTPTDGSARVVGFDVVRQSAQVRRRIGVTFQETVMDKSLSGRTLLDIHGRLYQMPGREIKAKIVELVKLVELEDAIDRVVNTYSGGMKRRLELARGLMTSPEVLFLDEPTLGLDPQNRDRLWTYIQQLRADLGMTILITTHYMDEAEKLADQVGIIDEGTIVAHGSPRELIAEMGADVVSITGSGDETALNERLEAESWVGFVAVHPVSQATNDAPASVNVQVGLAGQAGSSLKPLLDLAEQSNFQVADISINRPSLNDVFLKHTGRRLRD